MNGNKARFGLFFFLFLVMFLPFLQHCFSFVESGKLNGYIVSTPNPTFSYEKWWDGSYQIQKAGFVNDSVGFRPDFVRINNQIDFSLFKLLHADDVFLGKDGQLFSKHYTDEYFGVDRLPAEVITTTLVKLKKVQDTLEHLGKTFVFAYAPSKAYYLSDKIPDCLLLMNGIHTSNYPTFKKIGDSLHINQLDLNEYFLSMKETKKDLLISNQGTHWTRYGALLGADSITKFIERLRNISMPELAIDEMCYSDKTSDADAELTNILNLIFPIEKERFCYPRYHFSSKESTKKPKIIFIGDSYVTPLMFDKYLESISTNWEFWSYFSEVLNLECAYGRQNPKPIKTYDWQNSLLTADCLVILFTPWNFHKFADKDFFLEVIYQHFFPAKKNESA
jgi:acetyltransferase AlgX (SGNH hydrolase-like protein)